ncbi:ATP-binding protein [Photobacterium leiognathi subsp. mandapamensis]|uniref:ATP-binding protein n=1 Tax=Photobacterium leiognathi TaxID=553611 RepID=UPI003AF3F1A0
MNKRIIRVEPSNNIFEELGNNTYEYRELLSELIDNAIASKGGSPLKIIITIIIDSNKNPYKFIIEDNAKGISDDTLSVAICPAGKQTKNSLNEHGLGMKQVIASLGCLESLITKTIKDSYPKKIREFKYGDIEVENLYTESNMFDDGSGTKITITNLKPIIDINATNYKRDHVKYLGARYRYYIMKGLDLRIRIQETNQPQPTHEYKVKQVQPIYFHPYTRENKPVILNYEISGHDWKAKLTFGYAPKLDGEYDELDIERPNKFHPYNISRKKQGLDIILHNRVILFHQLHELNLVSGEHSDYNDIRGEIKLLSGFTTAITKNQIIKSRQFIECIDKIRNILTGEQVGPNNTPKNYLKRKGYPEELPEKLLRDRLAHCLKNNPIFLKHNVKTEYVVDGIEGYIDILADGEAYEIKARKARAIDVYQLFMYMDIKEINNGYLVAHDFSTGAEYAIEKIKDKHNLNIKMVRVDDYPITYPVNNNERDEYF